MNKKLLLAILCASVCVFGSCSHDDDIIDRPVEKTENNNTPDSNKDHGQNATLTEASKQLALLNGKWQAVSGEESLDGNMVYMFDTQNAKDNRFGGFTDLSMALDNEPTAHRTPIKCTYEVGEDKKQKLTITYEPTNGRQQVTEVYHIESLDKDNCRLVGINQNDADEDTQKVLVLKKIK